MVGWTEALPYAKLYMATCASYWDQPQLQRVLETVITHLNTKSSVEVLSGAQTRNIDDMMDMVLRSCTGCGAAKDYDQALVFLMQITDDPSPLNLSRSRRARGFAIMAHMCFEEGLPEDRRMMNIDAVHRGAVLADVAASLGFVAPVVLQIADIIEKTGFRHQETCPPGHTVDRFLELKDLWRVYGKRKAEMEQKDDARDAKVLAMPNFYFCAAEGCGIEATHKSGLSSCAGKCDKGWKPSYCSKECQRKDWSRHKPFCNAEGTPDPVITALRNRVIQGDTEVRAVPLSIPAASGFVQRSPEGIASRRHERGIDVAGPDGGGFQINSSTMAPDFMRDVQYHLQRLMRGES
ncbi:uncharacterized protein PHACADRAFT_192548 [Phanerochaete carnosa HHB-10118-sp]|uniref:MYND-type domain-containing protein n=1 Tax=Phanerochaete carnosa (strain HHB-10118-sp) TaxID=650164 RepID=K5WLT4_PHACS|nr:uncharacterized protein PHACADRAFT_192548 [Phanerochaete carnosa HHB-10118-sp]EKM60149.1 hypothetical protein PHACADRAFT_192548 [Phanerochaete carnosa HHB-10118-sp]